jgi:hypothetical protein
MLATVPHSGPRETSMVDSRVLMERACTVLAKFSTRTERKELHCMLRYCSARSRGERTTYPASNTYHWLCVVTKEGLVELDSWTLTPLGEEALRQLSRAALPA